LFRCTGISQNILEKLPKFYRNIMHDLNTVHNNKPDTISASIHDIPWFNRNIRVDHNIVFWICWFRSGIRYLGDMLDSVGNFLSQDELNNKYQINCSFTDHLIIRHVTPDLWKTVKHQLLTVQTSLYIT